MTLRIAGAQSFVVEDTEKIRFYNVRQIKLEPAQRVVVECYIPLCLEVVVRDPSITIEVAEKPTA